MKIIIVTASDRIRYGGGMDRVIYNAQIQLNKEFELVVIVSANNMYKLLLGLYKIMMNNPFSFNFILFNSLASFRNKYNKYWTIYYFLSKVFNIKNVIYWHEMPNYYLNFKKENNEEANFIENKFKNNKTLHLGCSIENSKIANFFNANPNIKIVNNCVNENKNNSIIYQKFTVIAVGSIQSIKGTDLFTNVAIEVCKRTDQIQFIWCGGSVEKSMLDDCLLKIQNNNFHDKIHFLGHVESAKFLTASSHLYFSSSRLDSFPLSVLEAMSFGKNVIYYDSGGIKEQVGEYGIFIDNFDVEATVNAILKQYNLFESNPESIYNKNLYDRYYKNYTPKVFVEKLKKALNK